MSQATLLLTTHARHKGAMKRYRKTERGGGLFSAIEHEQAVAAKTAGILKLRDVSA